MYFHDKDYSKAYEIYLKQWQDGNRSVNVVRKLTDLHLQYGNIHEAIVVMEEYSRLNPDSLEARQQLGTYYTYAQQIDNYLANLEETYKLSPTPKTLRELSKLYNYYGEHRKQINVLQNLVDNYDATEEDYIGLAYLYAYVKEPGNALHTLNLLYEKFDNTNRKLKSESLEFYVSLLLDEGQSGKALEISSTYVTDKKPQIASHLAALMNRKGYNEEALEVLIPYTDKLEKHPHILSVLSNIEIELGYEDRAYERLLAIYEKGRIPDTVLETFVFLAVTKQDNAILTDVIRTTELELLSEDILLSFAELSLSLSRPEIARQVQNKLGDGFLNASPLVKAALELAVMDTEERRNFRGFENLSDSMSGSRMIKIIRICRRAGLDEVAGRIMGGFSKVDLNDTELFDISELYFEMDRIDEGYELFNSLREGGKIRRQKAQLDHIWAMFAVAAGGKDEQEAVEWLESNNSLTKKLLQDIYFTARDYKRNKTALLTAEKLFAMKGDDESRTHLAGALMVNGRLEEALGYFRKLLDSNINIHSDYIETLAKLAKKHKKGKKVAALRKELKNYIATYLQPHGDITDNQQSENKSAHITGKEKSDLAFFLSEEGFSLEAEMIFLSLVKHSENPADYLEGLGYILSKSLSQESLDWLWQKARNGKSEQKAAWLKVLVEAGQHGQVVKFIEDKNMALTSDSVSDVYYAALERSDSVEGRKKLAATLERDIEQETDVKRLKKLAKIARGTDSYNATEKAYLKIVKLAPDTGNDMKKELAIISFFRGQYSKSERYFNEYFARKDGDYRANFYYGEILHKNKRKRLARKHYHKALSQINSVEKADIAARSIEPHILIRLGNKQQALEKFNKLFDSNRNDKYIRADFASFLIQLGRYKEAEDVLTVDK